MKIIPAVDIMNGQVVRLYKGNPQQKTIYSDDPVQTAKKWESSGADMLHVVDLDATLSLGSNFDIIKKITTHISIPVQMAGGLRDQQIISRSLEISDRIVLGTLAFEDEKKLTQLYSKYQNRIVISVDHQGGKIVTHGWQKQTDLELIEAIKKFKEIGFTEFLLTNVTRDGTMTGPDLDHLAQACSLGVNVIASGGISGIQDIQQVKKKGAYGVILGKALYENKLSIREAKKFS